MKTQQNKLVITLKSDLCAGSGYAYAGIVDSDVCYDTCGLPYIPAKRLKGCLREAAELIGLSEEETEKIFGSAGQDQAHGVFLGNACVEHYEELYKELSHLDNALRTYVTPQNVLGQFTGIRAQTALQENGVAKDNSLRFTRVVNHYSAEGKEMRFLADLHYVGMTQTDIENFQKAVCALRNMGMNRNRGFGSVRCAVMADENAADVTEEQLPEMNDEERYVLSYCVKNTSPLVLSSANDYLTEKYISGQSVLGYFAGAYLRANEGNAGEDFEELFLKNRVIFSGLYPCDDSQDGARNVYYPAPFYINCLKKTKQYVNVTKKIPVTEEDCRNAGLIDKYASGAGNQPKRLRGQFVRTEEKSVQWDGKERTLEQIFVKEVECDIAYHHTKKSKKREADRGELLYSLEVLKPNQTFAGTISGQGKDLKKLIQLLNRGNLRFGKSKSSQYGSCVLDGKPQVQKLGGKTWKYVKGDRILAVLQSDAIFLGGAGYTAQFAQVRGQIRDALEKIHRQQKDTMDADQTKELFDTEAEQTEGTYSEIQVKELNGYYSKWNLHRQAVPAVCAGSTFEFVLADDLELSDADLYVGERTGEGYGKIRILRNNAEDCSIMCNEFPYHAGHSQGSGRLPDSAAKAAAACCPEHSRKLCAQVLLHELRERMLLNTGRIRLGWNGPAALGRVTRMLVESCNACPDDPKERFDNFNKRISSIKSEQLKKQAEVMVRKYICDGALSTDRLKYLTGDEEQQELQRLYKELSGKKEYRLQMENFWSEYLMEILVHEKYAQKGGK